MLCSGCGKDVPFTGEVCPYCQRNKSSDQQKQVIGVIFIMLGGWLGSQIDHMFIGAIVGGVVGIIIGSKRPKGKCPTTGVAGRRSVAAPVTVLSVRPLPCAPLSAFPVHPRKVKSDRSP